jgi:alpha-D-xyloside xylohydrolase
MVREGAVIPHIALAQSTAQMDWSNLELIVYASDSQKVSGSVCIPSDNVLHKISLVKRGGHFVLEKDPFAGKVTWKVKLYSK